MEPDLENRPAYRFRSRYDTENRPKHYQRTWELFDGDVDTPSACCVQVGDAALKPQEILANGETWRLEPNRKLMPNRWTLRDASSQSHCVFSQSVLGKVLNPLHKAVMSIDTGDPAGPLHLVDLKAATLPALLGLDWGDYAIVREDDVLAAVAVLPRVNTQPKRNRIGKLIGKFIKPTDLALVSLSDHHLMPPAVSLAAWLLHRSLTDSSGA